MKYAAKAELAYEAYRSCLDLNIAYMRAGLTDIERVLIAKDVDFLARVQLVVFEEQERLIGNLRDLSYSQTENIKLTATLKLGSMLYASRFEPKELPKEKETEEQKVPDVIFLTGPLKA